MDGVGHFGFGEVGFGDGAAAGAEAQAQVGVLVEFEESGGEAGQIAGGDEETGFVLEANLRGAVEVVGEDGSAGGHGLGQGARQTFASGEVDEDIHERDEIGHGGGGHQAGEDEVRGQTLAGDGLFEAFAPGAVAHEEEAHLGTLRDDDGGGGDEVFVTFEGKEPGDFADDKMLGAQAEALAEVRLGMGIQEGGEIEAAEDAGVLVGAADAGGEVLPGHGVCDGDEVGGGAGGGLFGEAEGGVGSGVLEGTEGGAVDGVDDDGDAGASGGEASQESGFAAMGVDDVGLSGAQEEGEGAPGFEVEPRLDGANQGRKQREREVEGADHGFEGTFGAGGGARDQFDVEMVLVAEAARGGEGIFLGAADDEAGDDVDDAHQVGGVDRGPGMGGSVFRLGVAGGDRRFAELQRYSAGRVGGSSRSIGWRPPGFSGGRRFRRGRRGSGVRWGRARARRGKRTWHRRVDRFGGGRWRG